MKLWGGRFTKETNPLTDDFNSSIHFDNILYPYDIKGSIAHAKMLGKQKIISSEESVAIIEGLKEILKDIQCGKVEFDISAEDIHMNMEKLLIEKIGDTGKKLHTGRSRNDQVALDMRMYVKDQIESIDAMLHNLQQVLLDLAVEHKKTIMPGYTHLQKAQPVTLAHHLSAYFEMFKRDRARLADCYLRTDIMPLGSSALAGTTYDLDREMVADLLDFKAVTLNSMDGVSDRDYCIEFLSALSMIIMHLSRFSEEIILWCSDEFNFIKLDDAYSTGSSIMPQKKNPDIAELVRGKTGRVYGHLMGLLTTMKGIPLAYNKDMQEDKEAVFDGVKTISMCLPIFTDMVKTMNVNKKVMYEGAKKAFTNATDAADWLVKKDMPFREAHSIIGKLVLYCIEKGKNIEDLSLEEFKKISPVFDETIYDHITIEACVNNRKVIGGPSIESMEKVLFINRNYLLENTPK
ncbi:argininosuccinate lyase [Alkalibacter saccharofermentans]|uniref:Argininosuccinate lyase n=1 Tax=Alkalibacter saccharofermentans DSM 14828 TaxID=1120975 RepID=A0A1M4UBZ9_9FIRM|nr:argininosuccinate lyase [Alkalibacter saccharofermentans]SHE54127.1 argininosuccinate lyase [Alkalibacter saccharofermentans DSM 14828]